MAKRKAGTVPDPVMCVRDVLERAGVRTDDLEEGLKRFGPERDTILGGRGVRSILAHDPLVERVRSVLDSVPAHAVVTLLEQEGFIVEASNGCVRLDFEEMRITVSRARAVEIAALAILLSAYQGGR